MATAGHDDFSTLDFLPACHKSAFESFVVKAPNLLHGNGPKVSVRRTKVIKSCWQETADYLGHAESP
jgi:hypothetical protein